MRWVRSGSTSSSFTRGGEVNSTERRRQVHLEFETPVARGMSEFIVKIFPADFQTIFGLMKRADSESALKAITVLVNISPRTLVKFFETSPKFRLFYRRLATLAQGMKDEVYYVRNEFFLRQYGKDVVIVPKNTKLPLEYSQNVEITSTATSVTLMEDGYSTYHWMKSVCEINLAQSNDTRICKVIVNIDNNGLAKVSICVDESKSNAEFHCSVVLEPPPVLQPITLKPIAGAPSYAPIPPFPMK